MNNKISEIKRRNGSSQFVAKNLDQEIKLGGVDYNYKCTGPVKIN